MFTAPPGAKVSDVAVRVDMWIPFRKGKEKEKEKDNETTREKGEREKERKRERDD